MLSYLLSKLSPPLPDDATGSVQWQVLSEFKGNTREYSKFIPYQFTLYSLVYTLLYSIVYTTLLYWSLLLYPVLLPR